MKKNIKTAAAFFTVFLLVAWLAGFVQLATM